MKLSILSVSYLGAVASAVSDVPSQEESDMALYQELERCQQDGLQVFSPPVYWNLIGSREFYPVPSTLEPTEEKIEAWIDQSVGLAEAYIPNRYKSVEDQQELREGLRWPISLLEYISNEEFRQAFTEAKKQVVAFWQANNIGSHWTQFKRSPAPVRRSLSYMAKRTKHYMPEPEDEWEQDPKSRWNEEVKYINNLAYHNDNGVKAYRVILITDDACYSAEQGLRHMDLIVSRIEQQNLPDNAKICIVLEYAFITELAETRIENKFRELNAKDSRITGKLFYGKKIHTIKERLKMLHGEDLDDEALIDKSLAMKGATREAFTFWTDMLFHRPLTSIERAQWDLPSAKGKLLDQWATVLPFKVADSMSLFWSNAWRMGFLILVPAIRDPRGPRLHPSNWAYYQERYGLLSCTQYYE